MGCPYFNWILIGIAAIIAYAIYECVSAIILTKKRERWSNTPKDVVLLHCFQPTKLIPNPSPFVIKVQTFLRMANIPYEMDFQDPMGSNGKTPWISINGEHISDSELIIEFLKKKFEKSFRGTYNDEDLSVASALRVIMDEHFFWGIVLERFCFGGFKNVQNVVCFPNMNVVKYVIRYKVKKAAWYQGVGRHTEKEVIQMMTKDLRMVSNILGRKQFICGDEACEQDCAIFAHLAQCVWSLPGSPYETLVNGELSNLKEYCIRMKHKFWPDWENCLSK